VTAYKLTRVGADGAEWDRAVVVQIPTKAELLRENRRLRVRLAELRPENERLRQAWSTAHDARILADRRANRASRVLASLGRLSPRMAAVVEVSRREIWRLDRGA
jgi:hypothetical protein